ncbi:hypothetical protein J6590_014145 [Homalodisca vitripennis]|nr:hypothetical protein J6590_014145 [Homalodisca vitripennis]
MNALPYSPASTEHACGSHHTAIRRRMRTATQTVLDLVYMQRFWRKSDHSDLNLPVSDWLSYVKEAWHPTPFHLPPLSPTDTLWTPIRHSHPPLVGMALFLVVHPPGERDPVGGEETAHESQRRPNLSGTRSLPGIWQVRRLPST